jgi:hypothetical protein
MAAAVNFQAILAASLSPGEERSGRPCSERSARRRGHWLPLCTGARRAAQARRARVRARARSRGEGARPPNSLTQNHALTFRFLRRAHSPRRSADGALRAQAEQAVAQLSVAEPGTFFLELSKELRNDALDDIMRQQAGLIMKIHLDATVRARARTRARARERVVCPVLPPSPLSFSRLSSFAARRRTRSSASGASAGWPSRRTCARP